MSTARFSLLAMLMCFAIIIADAQDVNDDVTPFARNVTRIIQDFDQAHAKKHQRPEKFTVLPTSSSKFKLLWVSTFDDSYGCLFSSMAGRIDKIFDVGYNASGEHVDLSLRNHVLIVTRSDAAGNFVAADFYRVGDNGTEKLDFVMQLVDGNEVYLDSKGKQLKLNKVMKVLDHGLKKNAQPQIYNSETVQWIPFRKIGTFIDADDDITLSQRPVLAYANYKNNEFATAASSMLAHGDYRYVIFKKQVGDATLKSENNGRAVYSLNDARLIKTMFRGYKDNELFPIIATSTYVTTHQMMPFSRWKYPEKVKPMEREKQQVVSEHFGGLRVKNTRWLANLEESDRKLYAVEFQPSAGNALAVIACFIGNRLVSTYDIYSLAKPGSDWLWTPGDKGNFMNALPELQGLAITDEGFELYMSQMLGTKRHMIVLREFGSMFIELIDQEF